VSVATTGVDLLLKDVAAKLAKVTDLLELFQTDREVAMDEGAVIAAFHIVEGLLERRRTRAELAGRAERKAGAQ
jgi:hypothetical protein